MPGLARKILVFAAVDGLVLQPLTPKGQHPQPAAKIAYKDNKITSAADNVASDHAETGFEVFGVVGLLAVSNSSFLILITRRQQVAQIQGKPIYVVTEVALTPLASRAEAEASIAHTQGILQNREHESGILANSDTEGEDGDLSANASDDVEDHPLSAGQTGAPIPGGHKRTSSVAEDVMTRKGGYGRFAQKWFSKKGWTADQRRNLGMTETQPDRDSPAEIERDQKGLEEQEDSNQKSSSQKVGMQGPKVIDVAGTLLPKLLRTAQILFGSSQSFYFSYEYDITRSLASRAATSNSKLPPSHTVLPLLQGFVGQRTFEMDTNPPTPAYGLAEGARSSMELADMSSGDRNGTNESDASGGKSSFKPFVLTLISRRSVKRAGLRYLRRGVDEEGNTANGVETEQILSEPSWSPSRKVHSFVQIRGSIPIFFSQSPYSFKPIPQLQHSEETNYKAFAKHIEATSERYGDVQITSLVEKHGNEAIVGDAYQKYLNRINESGGVKGKAVGFEWFDFHAICRGMKFENVSLLMETLGAKLDSFGDTVVVDGKQISKQSGVLRTNCMDCLDRTNVVQSACGRRALELQLKNEDIDISLQADLTTQWFNTLWADNGDAISKQYASTAALKGDFTRTRKRDYKGALTDMGLSISRFYSGIVNDYFSQAAIDYFLGNVTSVVFEDFEANLMSGDPAVSMQKMRQQAVETCQKLVVADQQEEFVSGWTLLTPHVSNSIKTVPFEESVLLLTDVAIYSCRFDWNMEKVSSFERIDLQHITTIKHGTYITSTLSPSQADEQRNIGMIIHYTAGSEDITRINTRSMSSLQSRTESDLLDGTATSSVLANFKSKPSTPSPMRVLALKALPSRSAATDSNEAALSENEHIQVICSEIERMVLLGQVIEAGTEKKALVESGDIVSLAEARRSTGLWEQWGHSIKKLVWA